MNTIQSEFNRLGVKRNSQEDQKQDQKQLRKKMSTREIEDLMGVNKQRYKRSKGGAIRSL